MKTKTIISTLLRRAEVVAMSNSYELDVLHNLAMPHHSIGKIGGSFRNPAFYLMTTAPIFPLTDIGVGKLLQTTAGTAAGNVLHGAIIFPEQALSCVPGAKGLRELLELELEELQPIIDTIHMHVAMHFQLPSKEGNEIVRMVLINPTPIKMENRELPFPHHTPNAGLGLSFEMVFSCESPMLWAIQLHTLRDKYLMMKNYMEHFDIPLPAESIIGTEELELNAGVPSPVDPMAVLSKFMKRN